VFFGLLSSGGLVFRCGWYDPPSPLLAYEWAWLESGVEDGGTGMLFVAVRRGLNGIANDAGLLARVARRLRAEGKVKMMRSKKFAMRLGVKGCLLSSYT